MKCLVSSILILVSYLAVNGQSKPEPYGANDKSGHYLNVGDAKIYYEIYGQGPPLLLLHGGLYGYIDEYKDYIEKFQEHFRVIAIATRGHGRSEIGAKPFSYRQYAEDAKAILRHETKDSVVIVGFSDGAVTAYKLASDHLYRVRKVVAIAGSFSPAGYTPQQHKDIAAFSPETFNPEAREFVESRKKLMPQPERWNEYLIKLKGAWKESPWVTDEEAKKIKCPVLIIGGDRDTVFATEQFVQTYKALPNSQLAIIPNAGHVQTLLNSFSLDHIILPFLTK